MKQYLILHAPFFLGLITSLWAGTALAQAPDATLDRIAKLQDRYRQNVIALNAAQLNGFRYHLRRPESRRLLDAESEPIPSGCRLLEKLLDKIFANLEPGFGVSLFQINLATSRAYIKMDSDNSGSLQEIEWTQREVKSVAALVDALLQGRERVQEIIKGVGGGAVKVTQSWTEFSAFAESPYAVPSEWAKYLYTIKAAAEKDTSLMASVKDTDVRTYSEIMTFLSNTAVLEDSLAKGLAGKVKLKGGFFTAYTMKGPRFLLREASSRALFEQALAAKNLKKLDASEASAIVNADLVPAYAAAIKAAAEVPKFATGNLVRPSDAFPFWN